MGMMRLPLVDENDQTSIDMEQVNKMVDIYMDAGFNYFDTAYIYHEGVGNLHLKSQLLKDIPVNHLKLQQNYHYLLSLKNLN